jgi:hypothetical protein
MKAFSTILRPANRLYAHTNIESKRAAVEKLDGFGDNLVTVGFSGSAASVCHRDYRIT